MKEIKSKRIAVRIKKGDLVKVLLGKDRGKRARVLVVFPRQGRVMVEGVNMVKKHIKPKRSGSKGQRVSVAAPMTISNVQLVCPSCKKPTRVGISRDNGGRQRLCKKCQAPIK
ncbi:MAG: 50S ribosomal protein L24 [Candidatus Andersenbacteria bacterium]|nr:50S ribosomal protein L24 [bacterium]MDZ4225630.1 50S ribosomal protein L24 [Candidatus Andersenbacteria bacterium]